MDGNPAKTAVYILMAISAVVALAPLLVFVARSRAGVGWVALALTLAAAGGGAMTLTTPGLASMVMIQGFAVLWLGGLICGLVAFLDASAERRNQKAVDRLLYEETRRRSEPRL